MIVFKSKIFYLCLFLIFVQGFSQSYQQWLKQQNQEMGQYAQEQKKAFKDFADQEWREFKSFLKNPSPAKPGPKTPPKAPDWKWQPQSSSSQSLPSSNDSPPSSSANLISSSSAPISVSSELRNQKSKTLVIDYFGLDLVVHYQQENEVQVLKSESKIKNWISKTSNWQSTLLDSYKQISDQYHLKGWAQAQLAHEIAKAIHPQESSSQSAITWYLLFAIGVDVRLATLQGELVVLFHTEQLIYGVSYLKLNQKDYYLFQPKGKQASKLDLKGIRTWPQQAQGLRPLNLKKTHIGIYKATPSRSISFRLGLRKETLKLPRNSVQEALWATYPAVKVSIPKAHRLAPQQHSPLIQLLKQKTTGMTELNALRYLLTMVQKGFAYQTDDEQFGYENYFFPEEILAFPASDCEDRAIFFHYLAENVLNVPTVLIDYPSHIAAAVALSQEHQGSSFTYQNKRFYIADPTYIGADIGMEMPDLKNQKRIIID